MDKDKRRKKTSYDQYMIYLKMLEDDTPFRAAGSFGHLNRDVDVQYISNKWEELAEKLNNCGHGPQLSTEEWKKRLNDWKNSTRAKYRKVSDNSIDKSLTPLERKALSLWGTNSRKTYIPDEIIEKIEASKIIIQDVRKIKYADPKQTEEITKSNEIESIPIIEEIEDDAQNQPLETIEQAVLEIPVKKTKLDFNETQGSRIIVLAHNNELVGNIPTESETIEQAVLEVPVKKTKLDFNETQGSRIIVLAHNNELVGNVPTESETIEQAVLEVPVKKTKLDFNETQGSGIIVLPPANELVGNAPTESYNILPESSTETKINVTVPANDVNVEVKDNQIPLENNIDTERNKIPSEASIGLQFTKNLLDNDVVILPNKRESEDNSESFAQPTNALQEIVNELKRLAHIKEESLRFEVAAFKFRNPGFDFEYKDFANNSIGRQPE